MPWFFSIPEFLKKRACRYLLQHYLGQFLEEKISLNDLTVDLYNGTGTISNVPLNVEAINEVLHSSSAPLKVLSGYLGRVTVSVPWSALLKDNCKVEISGLSLSVAPSFTAANVEDLASMTDSLFFSMTSSMQIAEEVLKSGPSPGEGSSVGGSGTIPGFEGMEALARASELVLARVQVSLLDASVQVNYRTPDYTQEYFLKATAGHIEFYDELSQLESSVDSEDDADTPPQPAAHAVKVLKISGVTVELGSNLLSSVTVDQDSSDSFTGPGYTESMSTHSAAVPIAMASGELSVRVRIKQVDSEPGPKLEVDGFLGSLHLLLSPQQLSMLLELAHGMGHQGSGSSSFEKIHPGQNRPIPKTDLKTIESQLAKHQLHEQKAKLKLRQKEDLFRADPFDNSIPASTTAMTESFSSSNEEFFSLDLNSSTLMEKSTQLEDSFYSTASKMNGGTPGLDGSTAKGDGIQIHTRGSVSDVDTITLHDGAGLQQLSRGSSLYGSSRGSGSSIGLATPTQSPPLMPRMRSGSRGAAAASSFSSKERTNRSSESQHDLCKYCVTLSGITVALLEADPMYTYSSPSLPDESVSATLLGSIGVKSERRLDPTNDGDASAKYSSVDEGGLDPMKYFENVSHLLRDGVNRRQLQSTQEELAQVLPNDHLLLWLSTFKGSVAVDGPQLDLTLSVASAELWEYLYRNQAKLNHITKPISVSPVIQLLEDSALSRPCAKLKLHMSTELNRKRSGGSDLQLIDADLSLSSAVLNVDLTLLDRLQPLLNAPAAHQHRTSGSLRTSSLDKLKHSLYMTPSNVHTINLQRQAMFNQAVAVEPSQKSEQRINLRANCTAVTISLRFPVPDMHQDKRPPWYLPSRRPEVLYASLSSLALSSVLPSAALTGEAPLNLELQFSSGKVYLSSDGSVESRVQFLAVGSSNPAPVQQQQQQQQQQHGVYDSNPATISIVIQPCTESALDALGKPALNVGATSAGSDELSSLEDIDIPAREPLPFSSKRSMFSTGKVVEKSDPGSGGGPEESFEVHSEVLVLPGSGREMEEFERHAAAHAHYAVACTLPLVDVHIPSRKFLETLYNRFSIDLALWEPATPGSVERANAKSMLFSCMDVLQPAATREDKFQMCKSGLLEEDSDEEEEGEGEGEGPAGGLLSVRRGPAASQDGATASLSPLAFSLTVERAQLSLIADVENASSSENASKGSGNSDDEGAMDSVYASAVSHRLLDLSPKTSDRSHHHHQEHGLIVLDTSNLHLFVVTGYKGNPTHDYLCAQIEEFSLGHVGSLECAGCWPCSFTEGGLEPQTVLSKLQPVLGPKTKGAGLASKPLGAFDPLGSHDCHMIAVAMEMKLDKERNSKTNKCALGLYNTTVQYHMSLPEHNCFKQLGDVLSLVDEVLPGYDPPSIITELHTQLNNCTLEYRPLYLPLHVVLLVDSVSLSTSVVTGAPVLVVRLVVDGTYLLLASQQQQQQQTQAMLSYVCVMEMEWFEMTLRLCNNSQCEQDYQKLFSRLPDVSIECSSNVVHFRTCVDSCTALRDLVLHLASHGDLQPPPLEEPLLVRTDYCGSSSGLTPTDSLALSAQNVQTTHGSLLNSSNDATDIGDLINDAMEDLPSPESSHKGATQSGKRADKRKAARTGSKCAASGGRPTLEIHASSEKSFHMDFCSDSEEDVGGGGGGGGDSVRVGRVGRGGAGDAKRTGGQGAPLSPRGMHSSSDIFSESDDDFCIVNIPTLTKVAPGAKPQVRCLLGEGEKLEFVENHFVIPDRRTDALQRPKHFPEPVMQYTLKELTILWHLYGGRDFAQQQPASLQPSPGPATSPASSPLNPRRSSRDTLTAAAASQAFPSRSRSNSGSSSSKGFSPAIQRKFSTSPVSVGAGFGKSKRPNSAASAAAGKGHTDWKVAGGPGRNHSVLMELELDKLRIQHETYPKDTEQASRLVLLVHDIEIRDRLAQSQINKFLYQYVTEAMPRQSHANMVSLKVLFTRPELESRPSIEEAAVRLSVLPIRLNMDQDAILFLYDFFKQVADTTNISGLATTESSGPTSEPTTAAAASVASTVSDGQPAGAAVNSTATAAAAPEVFIKSFVFHPDLPIRIDYWAKGFKIEAVGTLAGILLGLSHLDCSEVRLKSLTYKKGLLGWDKVLQFATTEWVQDIRGSQLPLILKGVGPMHHVTQLVYGVVDLFRLPYQQYQEDGRIVWGLQQGATAFTASTGVAVVELTSRVLETVQSFTQLLYDMVASNEQSSQALVHQHKPHQPLDFREGFANAYDVVTAGIGGTATGIYNVAAQEHEERGVTGAVGGVLRQLPGTFVKPIILASEATRHVLGGVKNQFVPDARREASEKWKTSENSEQ